MSARTLDNRTSLLALLTELRYSLSRLAANPLAQSHVAAFQALRDEWLQVLTKELSLIEAGSDAQAKVDASDEGLDDYASRLSKAVLTITKDNRAHPLYVHFFGKKALNEFRKPTLGGQLEAMRAWIPSLQTSEHASLKAMAPELVTLVAAADAAVKAKNDARQQNRQFRDVGERRQFIDKLNAKRKETHGALAKLPHEQPGLPRDFADQFFRSEGEAGEIEEDEAPTVESMTGRVALLKNELAEAEAQLAALVAEEAEKAKNEAEAAVAEKELAALEKELAEKTKQAEALKAKLGKK